MVPHPSKSVSELLEGNLSTFNLELKVQFENLTQWTMQRLGNDKLNVRCVLLLINVHNGHLDLLPYGDIHLWSPLISCSKYTVKITSEKDIKIVVYPQTTPGTVSQGHVNRKCSSHRHCLDPSTELLISLGSVRKLVTQL